MSQPTAGGHRNGDTTVVVAAFNEDMVIGDVIDELTAAGFTCVVVDDGSTDKTAEVARAHGAHVLRHPFNAGQGAAIRTGIEYALRRLEPDHIATFDADGQHRVEDLEAMVEVARRGDCDMVLGSRFRGEAQGITLPRRLMLKAAVRFTRRTTGLDVTDTHNGLRLLTRKAASDLDLHDPGMGHASEILERCAALGWKVEEIPTIIRYTEYSKQKGQSTINSISLLFDWLLSRMR